MERPIGETLGSPAPTEVKVFDDEDGSGMAGDELVGHLASHRLHHARELGLQLVETGRVVFESLPLAVCP
jgi:hypothetical protein